MTSVWLIFNVKLTFVIFVLLWQRSDKQDILVTKDNQRQEFTNAYGIFSIWLSVL